MLQNYALFSNQANFFGKYANLESTFNIHRENYLQLHETLL